MKVLLIALLAFIGAAVYLDGRYYDEEIFKIKLEPANKYKTFAPDKILNLVKVGPPQFYNKENLYEYINGHAEFYLSYGFIQGMVVEYKDPTKEGSEPSVAIELFDMGEFKNGLGALLEYNNLAIEFKGDLAMVANDGVIRNFIKGGYKVKVESFDKEVNLSEFLVEYIKHFADIKDMQSGFTNLPDAKVKAMNFVKSDFLGLALFKDVYIKEYESNNQSYRGFLIDDIGGSDLSKKVIKHYKEYEVEIVEFTFQDMSGYDILDEYEPFSFITIGDMLIGITGDYTNELKEKYFIDVQSNLLKVADGKQIKAGIETK
ncbi:MAG: DUF6599 family protein [Nitrospinota bacterium]